MDLIWIYPDTRVAKTRDSFVRSLPKEILTFFGDPSALNVANLLSQETGIVAVRTAFFFYQS